MNNITNTIFTWLEAELKDARTDLDYYAGQNSALQNRIDELRRHNTELDEANFQYSIRHTELCEQVTNITSMWIQECSTSEKLNARIAELEDWNMTLQALQASYEVSKSCPDCCPKKPVIVKQTWQPIWENGKTTGALEYRSQSAFGVTLGYIRRDHWSDETVTCTLEALQTSYEAELSSLSRYFYEFADGTKIQVATAADMDKLVAALNLVTKPTIVDRFTVRLTSGHLKELGVHSDGTVTTELETINPDTER